MKTLLLAAATIAAVACSTEPTAVRVAEHQTSAGGDMPGDSRASSDHPPADPTTTVAVTTTTTTEAPTTTTTEPEPVATTVTVRRTATTTAYEAVPSPQGRTTGRGSEPPAGDTPPDYIKQCESGGNYRAINPNGHYGAWQFSQSTWNSVGGTGRPDHATPAEQDYRAAILWDGGRGASHWACA